MHQIGLTGLKFAPIFFFSVISLEPDAVSYSFLFLMVVILCFIIWFFRRLFTRLMFLVSNNISIV